MMTSTTIVLGRILLIVILFHVALINSSAEEDKPALYKKVGTIARTDRILAISDSCVVYSDNNGLYVFDSANKMHKKVWDSQPLSISLVETMLRFTLLDEGRKNLRVLEYVVGQDNLPRVIRVYNSADEQISYCDLYYSIALIGYPKKSIMYDYVRDVKIELDMEPYGYLFSDQKSVFAITGSKIFGIAFHYLCRIDIKSMTIVWEIRISAPPMYACRVLSDGKYVLIKEDKAFISCLDYETGKRLGKVRGVTHSKSMLVRNGYLYYPSICIGICQYDANGIREVKQVRADRFPKIIGFYKDTLWVLTDYNGIDVYSLGDLQLLEKYTCECVFEGAEDIRDALVYSMSEYDNGRRHGFGDILGRTCVICKGENTPRLIYYRY